MAWELEARGPSPVPKTNNQLRTAGTPAASRSDASDLRGHGRYPHTGTNIHVSKKINRCLKKTGSACVPR